MTKKDSRERLFKSALFYLGRFDVSVQKMRLFLLRRMMKNREETNDISQEERSCVETVIQKLLSDHFLDDARYARNQIRILSEQGKSTHFIRMKLLQNGIGADLIRDLFSEQEPDDAEQAKKFVKKKKIGPFRNNTSDFFQKDLNTLGRAGFSYETAKHVLTLPPEEF